MLAKASKVISPVRMMAAADERGSGSFTTGGEGGVEIGTWLVSLATVSVVCDRLFFNVLPVETVFVELEVFSGVLSTGCGFGVAGFLTTTTGILAMLRDFTGVFPETFKLCPGAI